MDWSSGEPASPPGGSSTPASCKIGPGAKVNPRESSDAKEWKFYMEMRYLLHFLHALITYLNIEQGSSHNQLWTILMVSSTFKAGLMSLESLGPSLIQSKYSSFLNLMGLSFLVQVSQKKLNVTLEGNFEVGYVSTVFIHIYRVLKKSCRKIIANFFKNMGDSDFLSLLGAPQMWSI